MSNDVRVSVMSSDINYALTLLYLEKTFDFSNDSPANLKVQYNAVLEEIKKAGKRTISK